MLRTSYALDNYLWNAETWKQPLSVFKGDEQISLLAEKPVSSYPSNNVLRFRGFTLPRSRPWCYVWAFSSCQFPWTSQGHMNKTDEITWGQLKCCLDGLRISIPRGGEWNPFTGQKEITFIEHLLCGRQRVSFFFSPSPSNPIVQEWLSPIYR